ncbi:MAG: DNA polymerase I [uncultured bacterium (gcode 4)]|uniref:DNA-directed DNA polymerase n=1 Tax=uncultured bacterium (gcode 4) TaxID=1234023 RepID=K2GG08_9BACT|nr:MAG: DNA polymerase I [uncultured bacterium (gcode 4)]
MTKFYDIKLKEYIFAPRFRNSDFKTFIEQSDNFILSNEKKTASYEKAYFAWANHLADIDYSKPSPSQEFIFSMESQLLEVLSKMEYEWFKLDSMKLKNLWTEMEDRIKQLEEEIYELVWERFNLNSPKQLQVILFEKLQIPTNKKIKTWFSVDNEVLELIWEKYAIAALILEHRWLRKLVTTYVEGLLKSVNPFTKRMHTTFNQTQAVTGRLSSENPNLQNIPSWNRHADEIKSCFIPSSSDYKILVADYSQVELRVLANLSRDKVLLEAFMSWEDIHTRTAKFLFWEDAKITSELRRRAKTVNFWVVYGISWFWLSKQINISPAEATSYINTFYEMYSGVKAYYESILETARETGYVETYFGRRRYVNWLNDANKIMKAQAEREAINMPIQWTAADVIKLAMIKIADLLEKWWYKTKMILQVHDELVFELHKDELFLEEKIKEIMENVVGFDAKLYVETWTGDNWKDAK